MTVVMDWSTLCAGARIALQSLSGNRYEGVLLGGGASGVFLRMAQRGLVRVGLDRLEPGSLELLGSAPPLARDDEVLLQPRGGLVIRGRVEEADERRLVLSAPRQAPIAVAFEDVERGSAFLLFRATSLRKSDQFLLRSRSGREYRGVVVQVTARFLIARLGDHGEQEVRLRIDEIDLRTVDVLIPLRLNVGSGAG